MRCRVLQGGLVWRGKVGKGRWSGDQFMVLLLERQVTGGVGLREPTGATPSRITGQRLWEEDSPRGIEAFLVLQLEESL